MSKIKIDNLELNPQLIEENSLETLKEESDLNQIRGGELVIFDPFDPFDPIVVIKPPILSGCKGFFNFLV
ncbi:hypothetical protein [Aphanothece sacrum]|uniref:Polyphosphate kinase n=1 Tax=Aphanothece sacrum FPU1 TaxID=1920663 RepID=A0A401II10_APHSA|nr:hypothetical protein [Aphanothece sacrum]GBF80884.1 polyphosphate kinase [Aphanothece sacrum FPU1]GBF85191.1 polyphosphate kinase [Aphanothece sacrum FPU3]